MADLHPSTELTRSVHRADVLVSCLHGRAPEFLPALKEEIGAGWPMRCASSRPAAAASSMGPVLTIEPPGTFYTNVTAADVPEIVEETLVKGRIVQKLLYKEPTGRKTVQRLEDIRRSPNRSASCCSTAA